MQNQPVPFKAFGNYSLAMWLGALSSAVWILIAGGFIGWFIVEVLDSLLHPHKYAGTFGPEIILIFAIPAAIMCSIQVALFATTLERHSMLPYVLSGMLLPLEGAILLDTVLKQFGAHQTAPQTNPAVFWGSLGILILLSLISFGREGLAIHRQNKQLRQTTP